MRFPSSLAFLISQSTQGRVCVSLPIRTTTVDAHDIFMRNRRLIVSSLTRPLSKRVWLAGLTRIELFRSSKPLRLSDPPPLKWSDLRYVFDIKEDCNGKEAIQA